MQGLLRRTCRGPGRYLLQAFRCLGIVASRKEILKFKKKVKKKASN
jgi:hypothetical protein